MEKVKSNIKIFAGSKTDLTWTAGLTTLAVIAPALLAHTPQNQWITGTIVNAILFVATWKLGLVNAALIAIVPSSIALSRGLLIPPQVLLLPYIIISNMLLIATFLNFKKRLLSGVFIASLVKFTFLASATSLLFAGKLPATLIQMMQWPQLITALAGGFIAIMVIKKFQN